MNYSRIETENHIISQQYPNSLVDLDILIDREDNESTSIKTQFNNSLVIDLDNVERAKAQNECRGKVSTMDCTFAIQKENDSNMLLVELRLNYQNLKNLNGKKLIDKVAGSRFLLGESPNIWSQYIFIFKTELKAEARNRIQRMVPQMPNNYIVMDTDDLRAIYFNISD